MYDEFCDPLLLENLSNDLSNDLSPDLFVDLVLIAFMSYSGKESSSSFIWSIFVYPVLPVVASTKDISLLISTALRNASCRVLMYEYFWIISSSTCPWNTEVTSLHNLLSRFCLFVCLRSDCKLPGGFVEILLLCWGWHWVISGAVIAVIAVIVVTVPSACFGAVIWCPAVSAVDAWCFACCVDMALFSASEACYCPPWCWVFI